MVYHHGQRVQRPPLVQTKRKQESLVETTLHVDRDCFRLDLFNVFLSCGSDAKGPFILLERL
jgi:hypothetical protein